MTEVFFRGYGEWFVIDLFGEPDFENPITRISDSYRQYCTGVFLLPHDEELAYIHTGKLEGTRTLLVSLDHPDSYFIRQELNKDGYFPEDFYFKIDTEQPMKMSLVKADTSDLEKIDISETEREKLLRQIGILAILLSKKNNLFSLQDKPNNSQIAQAAQVELDAMSDVNRKGLCNSNIRASIKEGLELLNK